MARKIDSIVPLGGHDLALVHFEANNAALWPNIAERRLNETPPDSLVGTWITCFGQGSTGYNPTGGFTGSNQVWKGLMKTVTQLITLADRGEVLYIVADREADPNRPGTRGTNIIAPGDSGGNCLAPDGSLVGAVISDQCFPGACDQPNAFDQQAGGISTIYRYRKFIGLTIRGENGPHPQFEFITPRTGWAPREPGRAPAGYRIDGETVRLRGSLTFTAAGTPLPMFDLPPEARPNRIVTLPVMIVANGSYSHANFSIDVSGVARIEVIGAQPSTPITVMFDDVEYLIQDNSTTIGLALKPGWVASSSGATPRATVRRGVVHLRGTVKNSTNTSMLIATLPANMRPSHRVYLRTIMGTSMRGALRVEPNGDIFASTQFSAGTARSSTSLEGASFLIQETGTEPQLQNGWQEVSSARAPHFVNDDGIVRFLGAIKPGTDPYAFKVPQELRPARAAVIPLHACAKGNRYLEVSSGGLIRIRDLGGTVATSDTCNSLEGLAFGL